MDNLREHIAIKAYCQHGFIPNGENDTQIWGLCPFCQGQGKLYVNKESKAWDCKVCHKSGGFVTFLEEISLMCQDKFKGSAAIKLAKSRGVELATLRAFEVGYNPITDAYTIPVPTSEGDRIYDLRYYKGGKLFSTYSCKAGLLNWQNIDKSGGTIWLCEGEWDGMAMFEILKKIGKENDVIAAVPGSGTFKPLWTQFFKSRNVNVLYDNDKAGQEGAKKVFNYLRPICKELKFLHWNDNAPKGYDLRDLYCDLRDAQETFDTISARLHDLPKDVSAEDVMSSGAGDQSKYNGEGLTSEEVYIAYKKWLHIPDTTIIDVLFGSIIANRMQGDPVWLFIVAPPGMTKTEYIQSIGSAPNIESISKLTPKALVSGFSHSGADPSLLSRLNGKILAIKDFTAIFGMNQQARDEIFSTLRDAYDGSFVGVYGHGEKRFEAKFGIVAGVTPAIQSYMENEAALGERFLRYETPLPSSIDEQLEYMKRVSGNIKHEDIMRAELKATGTQCLSYNFTLSVDINDDIERKVFFLALWTAIMRANIVRDKYSQEVILKPFKEIGTRLSKQYLKLIMGICQFRRKEFATEDEFNIIKRLARNTVPTKNDDFIFTLYKCGTNRTFTQNEMAELIRLPATVCARLAENMFLLDVLEKDSLPGVKLHWKFTSKFIRIVEESEIYK